MHETHCSYNKKVDILQFSLNTCTFKEFIPLFRCPWWKQGSQMQFLSNTGFTTGFPGSVHFEFISKWTETKAHLTRWDVLWSSTPWTQDVVDLTPAFGICNPTCVILALPNLVFFPLYLTPLFYISYFLFHFKELLWLQTTFSVPEPLVWHCFSHPLCVCRSTILLIPLVMVCIGRGIKHHHWDWFFWLSYNHEKQGFSTICSTAF